MALGFILHTAMDGLTQGSRLMFCHLRLAKVIKTNELQRFSLTFFFIEGITFFILRKSHYCENYLYLRSGKHKTQ